MMMRHATVTHIGRERHEAVDEHAADALAQQITNIILLH